jgi:hypothetical protein
LYILRFEWHFWVGYTNWAFVAIGATRIGIGGVLGGRHNHSISNNLPSIIYIHTYILHTSYCTKGTCTIIPYTVSPLESLFEVMSQRQIFLQAHDPSSVTQHFLPSSQMTDKHMLLKPNNVIGDEMKYMMRDLSRHYHLCRIPACGNPSLPNAECSFGLGPPCA